jgi:hypothetical protein
VDKEADLMRQSVSTTVENFSNALRNIPDRWTDRQRLSRRLLRQDPMERLVQTRLLGEGAAMLIRDMRVSANPVVLFMDRMGGGDGARAAEGLISLIAGQWPGFTLIHVAFATPDRGAGILVRNAVVRAGAEHGVTVYVVAHDRPAEGLRVTDESAHSLTAGCDLVVTFSPGGAAGLARRDIGPLDDPLLAMSHLAVLSYLDPESAVAQLPVFGQILESEPSVNALRFWLQIATDGSYQDLGSAVLGAGGDAQERLWVLLDNAKRHCYRMLIEPLSKGLPVGDPLCCPCRRAIEEEIGRMARLSRIVPVGNRLVAVARGQFVLS